MKITKFILSIIICLTFTTSCAIKGNFKGLYSYYKKTESANPNLFLKSIKIDSLCLYTYENLKSKIVIINGNDLKKCISQKELALVYFWNPNCKSKICYPLELVENYCSSRNIDLFIVAEYYDLDQMQVSHNIKRPIFGIDTKYYKTNLTKKYLSHFLKDIDINITTDDRYFYFKNGVFSKSYKSVYDL